MANGQPHPGGLVSETGSARIPGPESLVGKHVTLERLTRAHFPDLYEHAGSHEDVWTWWPSGPFGTASDFVRMFDSMAEIDNLTTYAILTHSGPSKGKAVGCAFIQWSKPLTNRVGEIGVFFGPALQKTRAATEVIFLISCLLFDKLNYRRMAWKTNSLNVVSRKAAGRWGLVYEGTFRQDQIVKGRNRDTCFYSMIDFEWPMCKRVFEEWLDDENFDEHQRQRRKMDQIRDNLRHQFLATSAETP